MMCQLLVLSEFRIPKYEIFKQLLQNLLNWLEYRDFILFTECLKIADLFEILLDQPTGIFSGEKQLQ